MIAATLTVNGTTPPAIGSFGKGVKGARALSFGRSGGRNCPTGCPYHPTSTSDNAAAIGARCYAARVESRHDRQTLAAKLDRHELTAGDDVLALAALDLDRHGWRLPWFRFAVFGSVPVKCTTAFRRFTAKLCKAGTPVHLPVFSAEQAAEYRRGLDGLPVVVRESVPVNEWHAASGAVSTVVRHAKQRERVRLAKLAAATRQAFTGRRCIVCPATAARFLKTGSDVAKCGACTACADNVDIVYPAT